MFRRTLKFLFLNLLLLPAVRAQSDAPADSYINKGSVTNVQVNARHFVNEGRFSVNSTVPWDSQNTLTFTNRGTMTGSVGFRFETVDGGFGQRRQALSFYNAPGASITSPDGGGVLPFNTLGGFTGALFQPDVSYLSINALNLTNRGDLTVGANGVMKLFGGSIDLTAGTLIVEDSVSSGFFGFGNVTETNFFPSTGVYDLGYGLDLVTNMPVAGIVRSVNPNNIQTPLFGITNSASVGTFIRSCVTSFALQDAQVWLRDQILDETNRVIQVIAVDVPETNIVLASSFLPIVLPNGLPQGGYLSPIVEFRVASTNFRTLEPQTNSLYLFDQLGSGTNYNLSQNIVAGTLRPAPLILFRGASGFGDGGFPADSRSIPLDIFTSNESGDYLNRIVTNQYASYAAEIQSVASRLPALPDLGVTNLAGRVEITANNLRMNNTRIRGEGLISITATNLTGGQSSVLDVPHLNMTFTSTTNVLDLKDMTPDSVERFGGFLQVYSGIWTNVYTNLVFDPVATNTVTNLVETRFQLLAISGRDLHSREGVLAHELKLSAPGTVIYEDNLNVTNLVLINTPNLTLAEGSRLYLAKGVGFTYTNVLNVSTFTNLGTIQVNELAELRKNETNAYDSFVNYGDIIAFGTDITADYFESTGNITSSNYYTFSSGIAGSLLGTDCFGRPSVSTIAEGTEGAITINASTARIDAGIYTTRGDVRFNGSVFKINNHQAAAGGRLVLNVTDILTDSGEQARNVWTVSNGFEMGPTHPAGDLLGSEIRSFASRLAYVEQVWSSADRGATVSGFTDNVALGRLLLRGDSGSNFQFIQGAPNSALYVDVLQIDGLQASSLREFTNRVQLGMNIYFGNIESTNSTFTAERINGILGPDAPYNFIWVPEWAGPNSGVDVPLTENGPVRRFNRALRESANIDSDGDGLPNRFDPFPFPAEAFGITGITVNTATKAVSFGFSTTTQGKYIVEYSTDLVVPNWQPLTILLQNNSSGGILSYTDQVKEGDPQRYYRVRKAP